MLSCGMWSPSADQKPSNQKGQDERDAVPVNWNRTYMWNGVPVDGDHPFISRT